MEDGTPLNTLEDAKRYFQEMGCSHFHMCREWTAKYDEYRRLGISKEQEIEWTADACHEAAGLLKGSELKPDQLWWQHSKLATLVDGAELWELLEDVYEATLAIESRLPSRGRMLVAETIAGKDAMERREGLIFQSYDAGRPSLATQFAAAARRLAAGPFDRTDVDLDRVQRALARVAQIERACGLASR